MEAIAMTLFWTAATFLSIVAWRRVFPSPMPRVFDFILNTGFRRRTFSPEVAAERHGLAPGMRVLEIGPAGGYLTSAAVGKIKPGGRLVSLDLQLPLLKTLRSRLGEATPPLVCGNACQLPFRDTTFDLLFVVEVMGEIPDKRAALSDFRRVLRHGGILAVSEAALFDPDYVRASILQQIVTGAGFEPRERFESRFQYTHRFSRPAA